MRRDKKLEYILSIILITLIILTIPAQAEEKEQDELELIQVELELENKSKVNEEKQKERMEEIQKQDKETKEELDRKAKEKRIQNLEEKVQKAEEEVKQEKETTIEKEEIKQDKSSTTKLNDYKGYTDGFRMNEELANLKSRETGREMTPETQERIRQIEERNRKSSTYNRRTGTRTNTNSTIGTTSNSPEYIHNYQPTINDEQKQIGKARLTYKPYQISNLTERQFNWILEDTYMEGLGYVFVEIEQQKGFNGLFALGVLHTEQGLTKTPRPTVRRTCNPFGILYSGPGSGSRNFCVNGENPETEEEFKQGLANGVREFAQNNTRGSYERVGFLDRKDEVDVTEFGRLYCGGNSDRLWNGRACMSSSGRWDEMVVNAMNNYYRIATNEDIETNNHFRDAYSIYLTNQNNTREYQAKYQSNGYRPETKYNLVKQVDIDSNSEISKRINRQKIKIEKSIVEFVEKHDIEYNKNLYLADLKIPTQVIREYEKNEI